MRFSRIIASAVLTGLFAAGCTVQPLYAPEAGIQQGQAADLQSIYVDDVGTRVAQVTRNELIFLINRGAGQPADPLYSASLSVSETTVGAFIVQNATRDGEPTAQTVTVTGTYVLRRNSDGHVVGERTASVSASFDVSRQEFANVRAERDAQNRAAKELAEQLFGLMAIDLRSESGA